MSTLSYADTKTVVSGLALQLSRERTQSSRVNQGLTQTEYSQRDALANGPKQAGVNGVLKGADDALDPDSPYSESTAVSTSVPL